MQSQGMAQQSPRSSSSVEFLPWDELYAYLASEGGFRQGDHVAIIGPTGGGKTHIAIPIAELRDYVLFVACKPSDPLIDDLQRDGYWVTSKMEIPYREHDGRYVPVHKKVVFWPRLHREDVRKMRPENLLTAEKAHQRPAVASALGYVRKNGHWCIVLDEATYVCRDLNLQRQVDSALFQFRTLKASIIVCGQRPSWMGRYALSSPTFLFIFGTNDLADRKALGDISGVDSRMVEQAVQQLDFRKHEVLFIDTRAREMFVTIAPPR
jgi:hypothetical protein